MPDDQLPPPSDDQPQNDDSEANDAFSQFVNDELDVTSLENTSDEAPAPPTPPLFARRLFKPQLDDQDSFDDDDDDDDNTRPALNPFSSPPRPFSGSFSSRLGGPSTPRRHEFPSLNDWRWIDGVYQVEDELRVYKEPNPLHGFTRYMHAHLRWNKTVRYINEVATGWAAVSLGGKHGVKGYVRASEVKLVPGTGFHANLQSWMSSKTNLLDALGFVCVLLLLLLVIYEVDRQSYQNDHELAALQQIIDVQQTQFATLEARIDALETQLND